MTIDYDETVGYAGGTDKFFQYIQIEMDAENKVHQVIFNISMMYYHLYPVMLIAGFPVVKPADMYSVAHPLVWAVLLDYVLFIFKKTAEGKDLNIKYFSQEFQNISKEVYSGFRQIVAAAEPHEIMDIYRDAFVETEAMVGGGEGNLFSIMFPGQSGGGGAGGPNGPGGVTNTTLATRPEGRTANTTLATGVAGHMTAANQRLSAIAESYRNQQIDRLAYLATPEKMRLVRAELQKLVDNIKNDIHHTNKGSTAKLSDFGKQLKAAIDMAIEATSLGYSLKKEIDSFSPYLGPCGVVCDTFTDKFAEPAVLAGAFIATQTDKLDYVKEMIGMMPDTATGLKLSDLGYLVSKPASWIFSGITGAISSLGSGMVEGVTGLRLSFPCLAGTVACVVTTRVCCKTTREYIKASRSISRTREAELRLLNMIKKDVLRAALIHIERDLKAHVDYALSLSSQHPVQYTKLVMDVPINVRSDYYQGKLYDIDDNSNLNIEAKKAAKKNLMFFEQAKQHAMGTMDTIFENWKDFPMERIASMTDPDKRTLYQTLLKDIETKNKELAADFVRFGDKIKEIMDEPGAALATGARVAGLGVSAAAMGITAAFVPQVAPALLSTAPDLLSTAAGFNSLTNLGAGTAERATADLGHTYVGGIQHTRGMLESASAIAASTHRDFMLGSPQPTRLRIGNGFVRGIPQRANAPQHSGCSALIPRTRGGRRTIRRHRKNRNSHRRRRSSHRRR